MFRSSLNVLLFLLIFTFNPTYTQTNVACVGNSITQGSGLTTPSTQSYPSQLEVLLNNDYIVNNYGEAGRTALNTDEWSYIVSPEWTYSKAIPHNIVIILLGTNDSKEEYWTEYANFKDDYLYIMNSYKNYPGSEDPVFILGLPPPVFDESHGHLNAPIVNTIIPMIKQLANETSSATADFYNALAGKPELFNDGVHPNVEGAGIMAEVTFNAIQELLHTSDPPPDTPTGLKTIPGLLNINLEWHANTEDDLNSYRIWRSSDKDGVQDYVGMTIKPDTTFSDNNVILDHIYYYSIDAKDVHNNASSRTAAVAGKTLDITPPSAPINLQVHLEADSVKLTWTKNTELDMDKYYVYRNTILESIQQPTNIIGTIHSPKSDFIDLSFNSATNYYYGIKAVDISGNQGLISNIVNITTKSRPTSFDTTLTFFEDVPHHFIASDFPFYDLDNDSLGGIIFVDFIQNKYFTFDNDTLEKTITREDIPKFVFTPDSNEFGNNYTAFSFQVVDSFGSISADTNIVKINLNPVNDAPHIDPISDIYIIEDSHNIILSISGINSGSTTEIQTLSIQVLPTDTTLIKINDIVYTSPENTGYVIINPVENVYGTRPITIRIMDDGGTENGGINFADEIFNLIITPTNDPPTANIMDKISINEDSETIIEFGGINAGPNEYDDFINMSIMSSNTNILPHPVLDYSSPDTSAFITFTTIPNVYGNISITLFMSDDGGTEFGGIDSTSYIIPVEIKPINDTPSEFNIITPTIDSTIVMNKSNYLNTFSIMWEESIDIENDDILYDVIFSGDLSEISRYGLNSTHTEFSFKEILAATDTVSIANSTISVIASDGDLQTGAKNSGIQIIVDGRLFAPAKLNLDQNHPNPFSNITSIGFDLPKRTEVSLIIYDLLGKEIVKLIDNKIYERGYNTIAWNGFDKYKNRIPSGIYIIQIKNDTEVQHKKLMLIK